MVSFHITHKSPDIMVPIFKALVRPILEYGNVVWSPRSRKHIDHIEKVQKRFTKRIIGLKDLNYKTRLELLKLPSLEYRRARGDMIETYKLTHGFYDTETVGGLFSLHDSNTRGHPYKLTKSRVENSFSYHFFTNRIINTWNNLPPSVVTAGTLNTFKTLIDKHWQEYIYSININLV